MGEPFLQAIDLKKAYRKGRTAVEVFANLDLSISSGEFVAVVGPSGSGKTSLLNLFAGFDRPTSGSILMDGVDITKLSEGELTRWRLNTVGFVFQFYNLISALTAAENVEVPLRKLGLRRAQRREHVRTALELVGLGDRASHYPRELSGGQEQRAAIARALVVDPKLILADEPTGNLDEESATRVLEILATLNEQGKTIVLVTHDPVAASYASRTIQLRKGALLEEGPHRPPTHAGAVETAESPGAAPPDA